MKCAFRDVTHFAVIARLKELVGAEKASTESNEARKMRTSVVMVDRLVTLIIVNLNSLDKTVVIKKYRPSCANREFFCYILNSNSKVVVYKYANMFIKYNKCAASTTPPEPF